MPKTPGYPGARGPKASRLVVALPDEEIRAIDAWGIPAGMESRTHAVRALIRKGLDSATSSGKAGAPATGESLAAHPVAGPTASTQ